MLIHAVTAEQMSEIDRRAQQEYGISQSFLMENAGKAVAEEIDKDLRLSSVVGRPSSAKIAVLCGKGNNGGDGLVVARLLSEKGAGIIVFMADDAPRAGAALENFRIAENMGLDIRPIRIFDPSVFSIAVDAMFGTGFKGELPPDFAKAGVALNAASVKTYAVDLPSGLDATTGAAASATPKAFKTVTFGLPKAGFFVKDGPRVCGNIVVRDIGFPPELLREYSR